jgi:hypothetical protein
MELYYGDPLHLEVINFLNRKKKVTETIEVVTTYGDKLHVTLDTVVYRLSLVL